MLQDYFYQQIENMINDYQSNGSQQDLQKYLMVKMKNEPSLVQKRVINEFFNYGPLHPLLKNKSITEIIINGPKQIIYEEDGQFIKHNDAFYNQHTLNNFVHKLNLETQTEINLQTPHLNTNWNNFRAHIIRPPIAKNTCITLRRQSYKQWNFDLLLQNNWATKQQIDFISEQIYSNKNILIIGSTGTGKTTILNACLQLLPAIERCVIIEDTDELHCPNSASTKLLTRTDPLNQLTPYNQSDLLKQTLRMRPQRIILGEVRGAEAKDYLMALSTGHEGGLCSLHANSARQALIRLEMLIQMGAPQWDLQAIRQLINLSLDYIITVGNINRQRVLTNIDKLQSLERTGIILDTIYELKTI